MSPLREKWVLSEVASLSLCDLGESIRIWRDDEFRICVDCSYTVRLPTLYKYYLVRICYDIFTRDMPDKEPGVRKADLITRRKIFGPLAMVLRLAVQILDKGD